MSLQYVTSDFPTLERLALTKVRERARHQIRDFPKKETGSNAGLLEGRARSTDRARLSKAVAWSLPAFVRKHSLPASVCKSSGTNGCQPDGAGEDSAGSWTRPEQSCRLAMLISTAMFGE